MYPMPAIANLKCTEFRRRVSNALVRLARKIYPANPEVKAFYLGLLADQMVYGKYIVRIDPEELLVKETPNAELSGAATEVKPKRDV